ncbi:uncharacterized protein STEHIDRAFT_170456 [Stereum hirsutum FP-91666 SS1]|uniref:uncharacterized protein n=1 Tax=Stereum hirsutum (strain FP-91666) TaxID=721885 RepID=UPI0004449DB9|nr:uncharacterized protein STEHIDRAFT_170456 [Stereum hirsutum FP-91666 SS1]EIM84056.1 hypothetical protein STEHIDRAFT_170456 [Stereum hirsutum FP-91666 SS1]
MTTFDQAEAPEGSELYRARAAVSTMLNCIAHDISKIPKTDPSRAENAILDMQIDDIAEVAEKYLQGVDGKPPANWSAFWEEIYILMHSLGSELEKGGYGEE